MKTITLTETQREKIALAWIEDQQKEFNGYRKVLKALLGGAHCAVWAWDDALIYGVQLSSRSYCVGAEYILKELKENVKQQYFEE